MALPTEFWVPDGAKQFKKAPPPKTGPAFGHWAGRDLATLQLPGGALMGFDLDRLTLADFRGMRDHYQVNASLTVLSFMMHRIDWRIECKDKKIAAFVEDNLRKVWTRMIRALSQSYWAGFSPIVLEYENDPMAGPGGKGGLVVSKFKDLVPEEAQVNWKLVDGYAPPGHLKPKYKLYDGIKQRGLQWPIPTENTLWYPLLMENGDYRGKKLLRSAFTSWYFSILLHLYANRYYERFGEPLPIGRAPYDDDVLIDGSQVSGREAMETILMNLRNRAVVVLPDDRTQTGDHTSTYSYDIEYLESQMRGADFEAYITRMDEEITLGLFTPLLLLRGGGKGSYNLGVQQMQMYLWILNALAGDLKEYIDNFVVDRIKNYNFGPNAPVASWEYTPMGKENVETMRAIITELIRNDKVGVDLEQLGVSIGLSLEEIKQLDPAAADPNAPVDPNAPPSDPAKPPAAAAVDTRTPRNRTDRTRSKPRGTGEPRATQRGISARIAGQVEKAYKRGGFTAAPVLGYRRSVVDDLCEDGLSYDAAASGTEWLYGAMNSWLADVAADPTVYSSAEDVMGTFNKMFEWLYERVLDGDR